MDAELLEFELRRASIGFVTRRVDCREEFRHAIADFAPDVILADYSLPGFDGMAALRLAKQAAPVTPLIVLTGTLND